MTTRRQSQSQEPRSDRQLERIWQSERPSETESGENSSYLSSSADDDSSSSASNSSFDDDEYDELDVSSSMNDESMRISILRQRAGGSFSRPAVNRHDSISPRSKFRTKFSTTSGQNGNASNSNSRGGVKRSSSWQHKMIRRPRQRLKRKICRLYRQDFPLFCSSLATIILCCSFSVWLAVVVLPSLGDYLNNNNNSNNSHSTPPRNGILRRAAEKFFPGVGGGNTHFRNHYLKKRKNPNNKEGVPSGCEPASWQSLNFPSCNLMHEINIADAVREQQQPGNSNRPVGVLDNGLWRDVLAVYPSSDISSTKDDEPMVVKLMKLEHTVDTRNFDRHRRDALVMERLTSSPYIVDIFGFCGNNLLTEFIGMNLEQVITRNNYGRRGGGGEDENTADSLPSRSTPSERLRLALEAAKALQAIHELEGGPIIHADLQPKQYLVTPEGRVKLNDFNRCRFMAHSLNHPEQTCDVHIPSSPGKWRAPEEYEGARLNEKLDIFSLGHVLWGILMGKNTPWGRYGTEQTKAYVKKGVQPNIPKTVTDQFESDAELADLTRRAYTLSAKERISARELVVAMETLQQKYYPSSQNAPP